MSLPAEGKPGTNQERTFVMIKPDAVQRGLVSKILGRFEAKGFKIVAMRFARPDKAHFEKHYADLSGRPFFAGLVEYMANAGPVVAIVLEGRNVILGARTLIGETDPAKSPAGSIRGDYAVDIGRNVIHGSDSPEGAKAEIALWFKEEQIISWNPTSEEWLYE
mmetsp:Transcript_4723/g.6990  ORF Transcript_4723/g.6990 Transcript_4723/m.6990 type:complete len:163 (+) Transcript_4723:58-546(+)